MYYVTFYLLSSEDTLCALKSQFWVWYLSDRTNSCIARWKSVVYSHNAKVTLHPLCVICNTFIPLNHLHHSVKECSLLYVHYFIGFGLCAVLLKMFRESCCAFHSSGPLLAVVAHRELDELTIVWGTCGVDVRQQSNQRQTLSTSPPGSWARET